MKKRKTHEEYVLELKEKAPNIMVVGEYVNACTPILHKCLIDGYEWMARPGNVLFGKGCPKCAGNILITPQEYNKRLHEINPNIILLDDYAGAHVKLRFRCLIDGYEWITTPHSVLKGCGCPKCAGCLKKTHEQYVSEVALINPNIEVIGEYAGAKTSITHRCKIDGYEWKTAPSNVLQGHQCPKCVDRAPITHQDYVERLALVSPDIIPIENYSGALVRILHKCKIDGNEWYVTPANALRGRGCPQCYESAGERCARQWFETHDIVYEYQKTFDGCKDKNKLPVDFYLPKYNTVCEIDGVQHFQPTDFAGKGLEWAQKQFEMVKRHDEIKTQYCKDNNINLIRIPYYKDIAEELNNFLFI